MNRRLRIALGAVVGLTLGGCAWDDDAGPTRTEERSVDAFDRIVVHGRADVVVRPGRRHRLELNGAAQVLRALVTTVDDGTLTIDPRGHTDDKLDVSIVLPHLRGVESDAAGRVEIERFDSDRLELRNDGVGRIAAVGRVGSLRVVAGGVGDLELSELMAREATITVKGVGSARVSVADELHATVTGIGSIEYRGRPTVRAHDRGLGHIKRATP